MLGHTGGRQADSFPESGRVPLTFAAVTTFAIFCAINDSVTAKRIEITAYAAVIADSCSAPSMVG